MIAGSLVAPYGPVPVPEPRASRRLRWLGLLLLLASVVGLMAWLVRLSPVGFDRWRVAETNHTVQIEETGTYVVFEEDDDAPGRTGESPLMVNVRSIAGRQIPVRELTVADDPLARRYDIGIRSGRAIVAFDIDRPGRYEVVSFPAAMFDESGRRGRRTAPDASGLPGLALARAGEPSPLGSFAGLGLLAGLPAVLGGAVLIGGGRRFTKPWLAGSVRGVDGVAAGAVPDNE